MKTHGVGSASLLALVLSFISCAVAAEPSCSDYERQLWSLTDEALSFRGNPIFLEFGWGGNGPTNNWLGRRREFDAKFKSEKEMALEVFVRTGVTLGNVYMVVDAYRDGGIEDSFWAAIEQEILSAPRCEDR